MATQKEKHMFYVYRGKSDKVLHIFSAPSPKRAVEKAIVREEDTKMHEYVVRRDDRDWGKKYRGRLGLINPPMVVERGGVKITISKEALDVEMVSTSHVMFE